MDGQQIPPTQVCSPQHEAMVAQGFFRSSLSFFLLYSSQRFLDFSWDHADFINTLRREGG